MSELDLALRRHKKRQVEPPLKEENKISRAFSKILLSIIFILSSTIFIKLDEENKSWFKEHVMESSFAFMKINDWYHQTFGDFLPSFSEKNVEYVSKESLGGREKYLDGYKIQSSKNFPIKTLTSGILVFIGNREGYDHTMIIQGVDGADIWYGHIDHSEYKLYDYIEEGQILGESIDDYYYLLFQKDGKSLSYEDYFEQV